MPSHQSDKKVDIMGESSEPTGGSEVSVPAPPPNGGPRAWLQAAGSFVLYFCTWGLVSTFGTFQTIYESGRLKEQSPFQISVIGSLQTFLMVFLGIFVGPIYDAGFFRTLLTVGSSLVVLGTVFQSLSTQYWQFIITQGVMVGIGMGCLSTLSIALPSLWFTSKLPIVNGIATSGSGLGGVLLPIMIRELHVQIGLPWTVRAMALLLLVLLGFANLIIRSRAVSSGPRQIRSLVDAEAFHDWPWLLFTAGCFTLFLGLYTPFVHVQSYALARGIVSNDVALYLLAIMNASSIFGRIFPPFVAQHLGPMNMIIVAACALSTSSLCLITAKTFGRLIAAIVFQGFFTGTFFALQPTIFVRLTKDPRKIGTRLGMAFSVLSFALLFGPPVSGALRRERSYDAAWIWAGITILAGGAMIATSRAIQGRDKMTCRL